MANLFITTHIVDAHAIAVQVALERHGHSVTRWLGADCPTLETQTVSFEDEPRLLIKSANASFTGNGFDAIWWRRQTPAFLPEKMHKGDSIIATREWETLYASMWSLLDQDAFWINPWQGQKLADSKILQLRLAKKLGFRIPHTLISNDADEIRAFVKTQNNGVVHKMFKSAYWENTERVARARTTTITLDDLVHEASLRLCPGCFQERIEKKYEVRATFFGKKNLSASIAVHAREDGIYDWRSTNANDRQLKQIELPEAVSRKCLALMDKLGLVFGCFDFVVTPDDEYVFLEVNEMGQFLWIEEILPEVPMLSTFCNFILTQGWQNNTEKLPPIHDTFADIYQSAEFQRLVTLDNEFHVAKVPYLLVEY